MRDKEEKRERGKEGDSRKEEKGTARCKPREKRKATKNILYAAIIISHRK